jgi:hypothetical protein
VIAVIGGTVLGMVMSRSKAIVVGVVVLGTLMLSSACVGSASAASAWWQLNSVSTPGNLSPGGQGTLMATATNLGDAEIVTQATPVKLVESLPPGLVATSVSGAVGGLSGILGRGGTVECSLVSGSLVECVYEGNLPPFGQLEVSIEVQVQPGARSGESTETTISGGNANPARLKRPIVVSSEPTSFGVEDYEITGYNENGSIDTQAGSHPFELTTTLALNRTAAFPYQPEMPKDLRFALPPGLVGNPTPFPQCSDNLFRKSIGFVNECPENTAVGAALVTVNLVDLLVGRTITVPSPLFNLKPATGEPARFGFTTLGVPVILDTSVRTGGDYGVTVSVSNIPQAAIFLGSQVTLWGVPGDPHHDQERGWQCLDGGIWGQLFGLSACPVVDQKNPPPLLSLPTSCTGPLQTTLAADSWQKEGNFLAPVPALSEPALDGCNRLPFSPSISVTPDGQAGSTPTGLTVTEHVPQDLLLNPTGLAEANVKGTKVTLPAGVALNPAGADGLESCSEAQVALSVDVAASCPDASKVGTVEIESPLLPNALTGAAYLAEQNANPFGSLVALYIVAQDPVSGTLIKVAGEVKLDPVTGQVVSTFDNTPQLPFEDLRLHFFGGDRAPLGTPALCGSYTTSAVIDPWSGNAPAEPSSTFQIVSGPNGSSCQSPLPFGPELATGSTNIQAGAFTPFTMTMSRQDGQQNLDSIRLQMPPGLLGRISSVALCDEAKANAGTCGPQSLIGHTIVSVGLGGDPYSVRGGEVFITGPYKGAPYGLSVVNPAKAGPFDLGKVVVRAKIEVDPVTAAITITTDTTGPYAIPQIIDGIPLQIKHVNVLVDRPEFTFNPTNCAAMQIGGSLTSSQGAVSELHVPFQVTNCATLGFNPVFKVSTNGKTSRANGASLHVKLTYPKAPFGSQANIGYVKVDLPKQLPSRLGTLKKACPDTVFDENPAACPPESRVGSATATTPVLPVFLEGPAYFVSHGGAKFPELIIALTGQDVTVYLHGETFISKQGITSSTFHIIPDVPIGTFELTLPQGPYSALAANTNLCTTKLKMPTAFTAQNGMTIKQTTPITTTNCPKHKNHHKKHKHRTK